MTEAYIYRNSNNEIYRYKILNHTDSIVCAAISILVLNTANSIEEFTDVAFNYDFDEKDGLFDLEIPSIKSGEHNHDVNLLLNSLILGLIGIRMQYPKNIKIIDKEV